MRKTAVKNKDGPANYHTEALEHTVLSPEETLKLIKQAQKDLRILIRAMAKFKKEKDAEIEIESEYGDDKKKEKEKITNALDYALKFLKISPSSRAMNELLVHNQRLIFNVAKKRYGCLRKSAKEKVELWDLVQVGNFGFYQAVLKFDPDYECALSTYADRWIQHEIDRYLCDKGFSALRLPVHVHERERLRYKFLREAEDAGIPEDKPLRFFNNLTLIIIRNQLVAQDEAKSMSEAAYNSGDGDALTLEDMIADQNIAPADVQLQELGARNITDKVIAAANLSAMELKIICHRFGIRGFETKTLKQLGDNFSLSRERIRQIEIIVLSKFRRAFKHVFKPQAEQDYSEECRNDSGGANQEEKCPPMVSLQSLQLINGIPREMLLQVLDMSLEEAKPILVEYKKQAKALVFQQRGRKKIRKRFAKQKVETSVATEQKAEPAVAVEEIAATAVVRKSEKEVCVTVPEPPAKPIPAPVSAKPAKKRAPRRKKAPPAKPPVVRKKKEKAKRRYGRGGLPQKEINELIALYYFLSQDPVILTAKISGHSKPTIIKYLKRAGL